MGDEYEAGNNSGGDGGNWWDSSRRRFESGATPSSGGWPTEIVDMNKAAANRSALDSLSVSAATTSSHHHHNNNNNLLFHTLDDSHGHHNQQLPPPHESSNSTTTSAALLITDPNMQIMGLGLSSQPLDWNPQATVFRDEKVEMSSFRSMLQQGMISSHATFQQESGVTSTPDHHHHHHWRQKLYSSSAANSEDSSVDNYKHIDHHRGFSQDHESDGGGKAAVVTCQGLATSNFQMDPAAGGGAYGNEAAASMLQGLLVENQSSAAMNMNMNYLNQQASYTSLNQPGEVETPSWSKFPQFQRGSPPKQEQQQQQLHLSNSTPFWNATATSMNDVRSPFLISSLQIPHQLPTPISRDKLKNTSQGRELRSSTSTVLKKSTSGSETSNKRARNNESASPLPAFKVRKEKMGDRITALQQLVSPFGKTDTASVLSEAIEYIKFLHEQVNVLSSPYMKQQHCEKSSKCPGAGGTKEDLRSRGLCLVPVSSTFPVTHETTVDFWTPTFGGSFR